MVRAKRLLLAALVAGLCVPAYGQEAPSIRRGDYAARMTANGLVVTFRGQEITCGSRVALFRPGWNGSYYWQANLATPTAQVTTTDQQLTITDALPELEGRLTYTAEVGDDGVTLSPPWRSASRTSRARWSSCRRCSPRCLPGNLPSHQPAGRWRANAPAAGEAAHQRAGHPTPSGRPGGVALRGRVGCRQIRSPCPAGAV